MKKNQKYFKVYCVSFLILFFAIGTFISIDRVFAAGPSSECTGGTITYSGGKTIHTFTSSGTFTCSSGGDVEYLVVAGGGGGGGSTGGGGGAGGFLTGTLTVTAQAYPISVGNGGAGGSGSGARGSNGQPSSFSDVTAVGGGGGAANFNNIDGLDGGSGGGASYGGSAGISGSGMTGQGYNGGTVQPNAWPSGNLYATGGGGGAGGVGSNGADSGTTGSAGGAGMQSSISGSNNWYAGGGGGGAYVVSVAGTGGSGGSGIGGNGGVGITPQVNATNGAANTGSGGGGQGGNVATQAGAGGSGIVIISYTTPSPEPEPEPAVGSIDSTYKYAWGEKTGWISFGATNGNVVIGDSELTGYAWSEKMGWISLNCSNTSSCGTINYKVINDGNGNLSGYAWGEKTGWISFDPENSQVVIGSSDGKFSGYAWGEKTGWISFNCSNDNSCASVDYAVKTSWAGSGDSANLTSSVFDTGVAGGAAINTIMWQGSKPAGTVVKFQIASSNNSSGPWSYFGPDGSNTTYYSPSDVGIPIQINQAYHNNHRYFRYKVFLETDIAKTQSPRIDNIIINWSR